MTETQGGVLAATVALAAVVALYRGQDAGGVLSWAAPAVLLLAVAAGVGGLIAQVLSAAILGWLFLLSFSERVGQWWWRTVLRRRVSTGALAAPDNYANRMLEAAIEPAWREHKRYLDGQSDLTRLRASYESAHADLVKIDPPDHEWRMLLNGARTCLGEMSTHLDEGAPDFEHVHVLHDEFRRQWVALVERRRRPWRPFEFL